MLSQHMHFSPFITLLASSFLMWFFFYSLNFDFYIRISSSLVLNYVIFNEKKLIKSVLIIKLYHWITNEKLLSFPPHFQRINSYLWLRLRRLTFRYIVMNLIFPLNTSLNYTDTFMIYWDFYPIWCIDP